MINATATDVIPPEWTAALNDNPGDFNVILALADWYADHDDELASEALRWAAEKRRVPYKEVYWHESLNSYSESSVLPRTLFFSITWLHPKTDTASAYRRIVVGWKTATTEEREEYWQLTPQKP